MRDLVGCFPAAGPADPDFLRISRNRENNRCAVLRPIAGPRMDLTDRTLSGFRNPSHGRPHCRRIQGCAAQPHPQSRVPADVAIELRRRAILRHGEIRPPIVIEVRHGSPPPFSVYLQTTGGCLHRGESALPVPTEQEASPGVQPRRVRLNGKEILVQENILAPVSIEVRNADAEGWCQLGFRGKRNRIKAVPAIQKHRRCKPCQSQGGIFPEVGTGNLENIRPVKIRE